MKILLDSCIWGGTKPLLQASGHDVVWAGDWPSDPGDAEILNTANIDGRILVTLDKDFGELAIVQGHPHKGIIRIVGFRATQQAEICLRVLQLHGEDLHRGAIVTVEPGRLRIRLENPG